MQTNVTIAAALYLAVVGGRISFAAYLESNDIGYSILHRACRFYWYEESVLARIILGLYVLRETSITQVILQPEGQVEINRS